MKTTSRLLLAFCFLSQVSFAQTPSVRPIPDIIVASRLDLTWSEVLIAKLRQYVINLDLGDPFAARLEKDIEINNLTAADVIAPASRQLVSDISEMVGIRLVDSRSRIVVKNLEYSVAKVTTDLKPLGRAQDGQVFDGTFSASGIRVGADEIKLLLEIPTTGRRSLPLIEVRIKKPSITTNMNSPLVAQAKIKVLEDDKTISFKVLESSFDSLALLMERDPSTFELDFDDIIIPQVSIQIGNRRINIDPAKVRNAIVSREALIKELLIEQLAGQLREGVAHSTLKILEQLKIPNEYWFKIDRMQMKFKVAQVSGNEGSKNVIMRIDSDFCTVENFEKNKEGCLSKKVTTPAASITTQEQLRKSIDEVKTTLGRGDVNMVASISEDYINKLISTTVDAKYFDEKLLESGATFGPTKTFVRLNQKGEVGMLYIDVKYKIGGIESVLVGGSEIRFPIILKCTMKIEKGPNGFPLVIFTAKEAVMDNRTLRRGFPQLGLPSTVERLKRFESKVVKTIREKVSPLIGQDIIKLELPVFKDVGIESLDFTADGFGRMSAEANIEDARLAFPILPR